MPSRAELARHPVAIAGVVIATVAAVVFITLALAVVMGLLDNPYAGLVVFIAVPALFVVGLLLIPLGHVAAAAKTAAPSRGGRRLVGHRLPQATGPPHHAGGHRADRRQPGDPAARGLRHAALDGVAVVLRPGLPRRRCTRSSPPGRRASTRACAAPTATSARARGRSFTTSWSACGSCTTSSPARFRGRFPASPIMRPALEVCGNCHWPNRDLGDRVRVIREYADDEAEHGDDDGPADVHVGGPGKPTRAGRAIHWHADPRINIAYVATDKDRQTIPWVQVTDAQGQVREYVTEGTTPEQLAQGERRTMDCVTATTSSRTGSRRRPSAPSTRRSVPARSAASCRSSGARGSGS